MLRMVPTVSDSTWPGRYAEQNCVDLAALVRDLFDEFLEIVDVGRDWTLAPGFRSHTRVTVEVVEDPTFSQRIASGQNRHRYAE